MCTFISCPATSCSRTFGLCWLLPPNKVAKLNLNRLEAYRIKEVWYEENFMQCVPKPSHHMANLSFALEITSQYAGRCALWCFSCSWLSTSCSQLSLPPAGGGSWHPLGFSAISLQRVRSSLALEGRMCQNHSPIFLQAVSLPRWVRPRPHRDIAHRMALVDGQQLIALSWFVRENTHLRKTAIT